MRRHALAALLRAALALSITLVPAATSFAQESALADAEKLVARAEYGDASQALAKITSGPDSAKAALLSAEVALRTGKYPEAVELARGAMKDAALKPRAAALEGEALASQGKMTEAIEALRAVEKEPAARRARLLLGEYLIRVGKRADAKAPLLTLVADYNSDAINASDPVGLSMVGRAVHLLRNPKQSNEAFNEAEKAGARKLVETLLWRAELWLDNYDPGHAGQVVSEAEKLAPEDPRLRIVKARLLLESAMDFDGAESEIRRALEVNPKLPDAFFVRAGLALRDLDIEAADKAADQGLATNPRDLDLLSMKGAIRFLADDAKGFAEVEKKVFAENPEYSRFYQTVSEFAEWEHRYDDIIQFMRRAVAVDPRDTKAHATLGLNLIRAGREEEGVLALKEAWASDRRNVRVLNTLNLFERDIANGYVTIEGQPFRIRYAKEEQKILERYVPRMLDEAWRSMVSRYGFTPKVPVAIELYADEEHFSVRTSGLPNVGIQGVCFGQTLALMSPRAAPFNWGNVLWHELGHVFAIQMSKNHVPRWYTEGLSEYETIVRRPEWQREEDPALFAALKAGRVPDVVGFNRAFTHVDSVEDVTMAYYAASQIIVFMVERYGWERVIKMMPRWASGERTPEVIKGSLGVTAEQVDRDYRAWLAGRLARYSKQYVPDLHAPSLEDAEDAATKAPRSARKQLELAIARLRSGDEEGGRTALDTALGIEPKQPDALYVLADLALAGEGERPHGRRGEKPKREAESTLEGVEADEAKRAGAARAILEKMIAQGADGYAVQMKLSRIAGVTGDAASERAALERASGLDPSQAEPLGGLVMLARREHDGRAEVETLRKYVLLEQHDREAWGRLLSGLVARNRWEEAVTVGESTVYVDVANPEVHRLYARALAKTGRHLSAVYEYNSAIISGAPPPMAQEIYRELGRGYEKLGAPKLAEQARAFEQRAAKDAARDAKRERPRPGDE